jgi:hypothetical protein
MISTFLLRFVKSLAFTAVMLVLVAIAASAQTVISSSTSSGSSSVGPGSGLGTLTWTVEDDLVTCTETDPPQFYPSYEQWTYSGFVYVDGSGVSHNMSGGASYLVSNGGSPPCPGNYTGTGTLTGDGYTIVFVPNEDSGTATLQPVPVFVNPKYVILAVTYAPPRSQSNVNYSESTLVGNSTALSGSFTNQTSLSVSVSAGFTIPGLSGNSTGSYSTTWSQEADTSSSVSLNKSFQQADEVRGPTSSLGVNHDYDVIWLWLNPLVNFNAGPGPNTLTWTGYSYDMSDIPAMDIYPVFVGYLNGHFSMPSNVAQVLARSWAANQTWPAGQGPGLTSADFATILAADPFSNPSYTVTVPSGSFTSTDGRFTVTDNQNISYTPPPPGGNPITQTYIESYQTTQTQGQGAKYTYQSGFGWDTSFSVGIVEKVSFDIKTSNTLTWTNQWSKTRTNTTTQSASLSVTGPAASDNYTGPTEFVVFQDNIYGTFMFFPVR